MDTTRRELLAALAAPALAGQAKSQVTRYVRYSRRGAVSYGILDGETIREIQGPLFGKHAETGTTVKLAEVKLLYPCQPPKILALAGNYKSHLGKGTPFKNPEIFYKPVSSLQNPGDPIVLPKTSTNVHYEGELVLVIGRRLKDATVEQARAGIFGVACGNDVSEREWQNGPQKDVQWWRAKGADTFGPVGPVIARGLDYGNLLLQTRLNGKTVQKQSTADLIYDGPTTVSFVSRFVTLTPGDLIFTGTPGTTGAIKAGDVVEVEIEGIGILRNPVAAG